MTRDQVYQSALIYFKGDTLAANVWVDKYCLKDRNNIYYESTPDDMHRRLAKELARIEANYPNSMSEEEIYELLKDFRYIVPQGSPMAGIGNDFVNVSLSNCFVIGSNDNSDSYGSIMRTDEEQVQLMKRRGGVGHDLSHLRPNGALANNSKLTGLSGAVSYAERYSNSTKEVSQGNRRGALMLTMDIRHPDVERFIDSKLEDGKITGANISIKITDEFMEKVIKGQKFVQTFPIDLNLVGHTPFLESLHNNLIKEDELINLEWDNEYKGCYAKVVDAKRIWNKIILNAWKSAEPGVLFWDRVIEESPADYYWETISTNPCGELPLPEYDSCRLLLLNLYSYVDGAFTPNAEFNVRLFKNHVIKAQRLMDDIVDLEIEKINKIINKISSDPEPDDIKSVELQLWTKILDSAKLGRRTGLGVTGEGDMLAALNLRYGSEEAIEHSEFVHNVLAKCSYSSSIIMAEERGSFPIYHPDETSLFLTRIKSVLYRDIIDKYNKFGRRNIANLTIAPAGSVSILTQTTSGIEPAFAIYYKRRRRTEDRSKASFIDEQGEMFEDFMVFHHKFEDWYDMNWYKTDVKLFDLDFKKPLDMYTESEIDELIKKSPYYMATANDMDWVSKVSLQGRVQKWVDHSISATTNVPKHITPQTVSDIYMEAWSGGCKGMTIYRDGSRSGILVSKDDSDSSFVYMDAVKRPKELICDIYHKTALKKNWMILVGLYNDRPYEIFAFPEVENSIFPSKLDKGKIIKVKSKNYKLIGKDGDKTYEIPNFIELIGDEGQVLTRKFSMMLRHRIDPKWIVKEIEEFSVITSFDKVIQRVLKNYVSDLNLGKCDVCGAELRNEGGCSVCPDCGFSKCN